MTLSLAECEVFVKIGRVLKDSEWYSANCFLLQRLDWLRNGGTGRPARCLVQNGSRLNEECNIEERYSTTPPETINFIIAVEEASIGLTFSRGTMYKSPEKLYEWGKYTATFSAIPKSSRWVCVMKPSL